LPIPLGAMFLWVSTVFGLGEHPISGEKEIMRFQDLRVAVLASIVSATMVSLVAGANATTALDPAMVNAEATACGPCGGITGASASQDTTLAQFGYDYNIGSYDPTLQQSGVTTPGKLVVGVGGNEGATVAKAFGPLITSSAVGGDAQDSITLDYWFEVVQTTSTLTSPTVDVEVTASGKVSAYSAGSGDGSLNNANVTARLVISPHSGVTNLNELAQVDYGYYFPTGGTCQCYDSSTGNVTGTLGATSSFSGGFNIVDLPVSINVGTPYEVEMTADLVGGPDFSGYASVDPFLSVPTGYGIVLSPGIIMSPGVTSVPEPSTWAMMLIGLTALGYAGYRRGRLDLTQPGTL
jgi:PEP-CTERM motif